MTFGLWDFLVTHDLSLGIANSLQNILNTIQCNNEYEIMQV